MAHAKMRSVTALPDGGGGAAELVGGGAGQRGQQRWDGSERDGDRIDAPEREVQTNDERSTATARPPPPRYTCQSYHARTPTHTTDT